MAGANFNIRCTDGGGVALQESASEGRRAIALALLVQGADKDALDGYGRARRLSSGHMGGGG